MWVDTKGEDGPQCIHHTPVGALTAQPPPSRPCRSLQYALQNALNSTFIKITCGTHELQPDFVFPYLPIPTGLLALRIEGECATKRPTVRCQNGALAAFKGIVNLTIDEIDFEDCGNQEEAILDDSFSTLYIFNCTNVKLQHITIHITGQRGSGIAIKNFVSYGVITLNDVSILHNGTHGTGIQCDIHGNSQSPADYISLYMSNVQVLNTNTHTEYNPSMAFTGIRIIAKGTGHGTIISLHNTTVFNSAPASGYGILVSLLDDMHWSFIQLARVLVLDGWDNRYQTRNKTDVLTECDNRQLEMIEANNNTVHKVYTGIAVAVLTSYNTITVTDSQVVATYGPMNVYALVFNFNDLAAMNRVQLKNVLLTAKGNPLINRFGLFVNFNGKTSENTVITWNVRAVNSTTVSGIGALLYFAGHCFRNSVQLNRSKIVNHESKDGGSIVAHFTDYAESNIIILYRTTSKNNTAMLGGGLQIQLGGFARGNLIISWTSLFAGNKAHAGGGLYIKFTNSSERNRVYLMANLIMYNTLIPSPNISMLGGGVHVDIAANKAMYATNNVMTINQSLLVRNKAKGGVGGGISVLYVHSLYTGERGDEVRIEMSMLINNQAGYGNAFGMQSSPRYRKALFRGITMNGNICYYTKSSMFNEYLGMIPPLKKIVQNVDDPTNIYEGFNLLKLMIKVLVISQGIKNNASELMKKQVNPLYQIRANTSLILLKSVEIRLQGHVYCGAASQGILAVDSEILLQPYSWTIIFNCVASHGGAIALYGESYIRIPSTSVLQLRHNHAFQRGGAIYVHSTQHAVPHVHCFLQHEHGQKVVLDVTGIWFQNNSAKYEGQSVYISEAENCFGSKMQLFFVEAENPLNSTISRALDLQSINEMNAGQMCKTEGIFYDFCNGTRNASIRTLPQVVSSPDHVDGRPADLDNPITVKFIPGKPRQLSHKNAFDKLGNPVSTVFTAQIITEEPTTDVQLNPF